MRHPLRLLKNGAAYAPRARRSRFSLSRKHANSKGNGNGNGALTAAPAHHAPATMPLNPFGIPFFASRRVRPGGLRRLRWSSENCDSESLARPQTANWRRFDCGSQHSQIPRPRHAHEARKCSVALLVERWETSSSSLQVSPVSTTDPTHWFRPEGPMFRILNEPNPKRQR